MKANELRVSNMIKLTDTGEIMTVTGIMQDSHGVKVFGITPDGTYCNAWIEHCEQITLTPEWLERFGFDYDNETNSWSILTQLDKFDYLFEISNKYQEYYQPDFLAIDLKYVHQLQNLYHAMTGTELTLTEKPTE